MITEAERIFRERKYSANRKPGQRTAEEIAQADWSNQRILQEAPKLVEWAVKKGLMAYPKVTELKDICAAFE